MPGSTISKSKSVRSAVSSTSNFKSSRNSHNGSDSENNKAFHPKVQGHNNNVDQNTDQYSQNQNIAIPKVDGVWNREKAAKNLVREWAAEKGLSSIYPNLSSLSTALPFIENEDKDSIRFSTAIAAFVASQTSESRTQLLAEVASSLTKDCSASSFNPYLISKQLPPQLVIRTQSPSQTQRDVTGAIGASHSCLGGAIGTGNPTTSSTTIYTSSPVSELASASASGFTSTSTSTFSHSIPSPPTQTYLSTHGLPHRHVNTNTQLQSQSQSRSLSQVDNDINMENQNDSGNSNISSPISQSTPLNITNVSAFTSLLSATGSSFNNGSSISRSSSRRSNSTGIGKVDGNDRTKKIIKNQNETKSNSNIDTKGDDQDFQTSSVGQKRGFD